MATVITTLQTALPLNNAPSNEEMVAAVNSVIGRSWPMVKLRQYCASALTLVAGTFDYELTAVALGVSAAQLPPPDQEPSRLYLHDATNDTPRLLRRWFPRYDQDDGTWTVTIDPGIVGAYAGKAVDVEYNYPHPPVTAVSDTVYLPYDLLMTGVTDWIATKRFTDQPHDARYWGDVMVRFRDDFEKQLALAFTKGVQPVYHQKDNPR